MKANPLAAGEPLASVLGRERAEAESDPSALARYRSYRLNHASDPTAARVFSASELMTVCARPAPPREGVPILSIDTGGLLSWSSGCAIWPSGRIELWAIAGPGSSVMLTESDGLFVGPSEVPPVAAILARVADFPEPPSIVCRRPAPLRRTARVGAGVVVFVARCGGGDPLISWATFKRRGGCYSMMEVPSLWALHCFNSQRQK